MIYFIITTSIFDNCEIRKEQYITGIQKLKTVIQDLTIENYKIIIVENNGKRETFLNLFGDEVLYTNNNMLPTTNKGTKELQDIFDCINHYNISDNDFIVKMTGRYILADNSEFMQTLKVIDTYNYDCVIKYGSFFSPVDYKMNDCITGLIGMRCRFMKQIELPIGDGFVEWKWGEVTQLIDDDKIYMVKHLGIYICPLCPGGYRYFYV